MYFCSFSQFLFLKQISKHKINKISVLELDIGTQLDETQDPIEEQKLSCGRDRIFQIGHCLKAHSQV